MKIFDLRYTLAPSPCHCCSEADEIAWGSVSKAGARNPGQNLRMLGQLYRLSASFQARRTSLKSYNTIFPTRVRRLQEVSRRTSQQSVWHTEILAHAGKLVSSGPPPEPTTTKSKTPVMRGVHVSFVQVVVKNLLSSIVSV